MNSSHRKTEDLENFDALRNRGLRPQVVACFLKNKKILFFYKREHDLWQLPQGGIDNQESIEQSFVREMSEELGNKFLQNCEITSLRIVHENQIYFPKDKWDLKELSTDAGKPVSMRGKKYFFLAIEIGNPAVEIRETEFDDCRWLTFEEATRISEKISQTGKRRITLDVLNALKFNKLL
jgi:8-oxo-dGTP pyrophosphatase MutT (NUDIX family)